MSATTACTAVIYEDQLMNATPPFLKLAGSDFW